MAQDPQPNFLLEIGVEEIPDWMIQNALDHLQKAFENLLAENKLGGRVFWTDATPRRLALVARGVLPGQPDSVEQVMGPPKSAGEGAAKGFARKQGVGVEALQVIETGKGEYYSFEKKVAGRPAVRILAESLPGIILGIPWPKAMYWTSRGGARFIRPIRWVVALFGSEVIPFEVAGVKPGAVSQGHRRFGARDVPVSIEHYQEELEKNHVLVRVSSRRKRIVETLKRVLPEGHHIKRDLELLDTLAFLTEYPTSILGSFDRSYLALPAEVLVTVMRHHQKYFSVEHEDGSLAPYFIAVMNTPSDPEGFVRSGNERVLRARFNDARFFWQVDQNRKLAGRVEDLKAVTYQKQLGEQSSYWHKAQRMVKLVCELGGDADAQRAALLCKCDLTTEMVKEFTELQGVVGGLYCRAQGEPEAVAKAVYEHYKPEGMEDSIPLTAGGQIVALADKVDTLRECFRIGLVPTGSKDPFALRRAAQGVVKILAEGEVDQSLRVLLDGDETLEGFLEDRVRHYFREVRGFAYDEVNAVMAAGWSDLKDLQSRLEALSSVRPTGGFEPLAASFKRIRNILKQAGFEGGEVNEDLLESGAESALYNAIGELELTGTDYTADLEAIAALRPRVDDYFDHVLVNAPDPEVRANRLALLHGMLTRFSGIADFSEIVTS